MKIMLKASCGISSLAPKGSTNAQKTPCEYYFPIIYQYLHNWCSSRFVPTIWDIFGRKNHPTVMDPNNSAKALPDNVENIDIQDEGYFLTFDLLTEAEQKPQIIAVFHRGVNLASEGVSETSAKFSLFHGIS